MRAVFIKIYNALFFVAEFFIEVSYASDYEAFSSGSDS